MKLLEYEIPQQQTGNQVVLEAEMYLFNNTTTAFPLLLIYMSHWYT